jgi:hypothetical protein
VFEPELGRQGHEAFVEKFDVVEKKIDFLAIAVTSYPCRTPK